MNVQKSIAIVAATLITAAGMAAIANYNNAAMTAADRAAQAAAIETMPAVNVRPDRAALRGARAAGTAAQANLRMPYYSFANDEAGV